MNKEPTRLAFLDKMRQSISHTFKLFHKSKSPMSGMNDESTEKLEYSINLLSSVAEKILVTDDLHTTVNGILRTMKTHLDVYSGGVFFPDAANRNLKLFAYSQSPLVRRIVKAVPGNLTNYHFPINSKGMLLCKCFRDNVVTKSSHLKDFFCPAVSNFALDVINKILGLHLQVGVPITVGNETRGVLLASFKKKEISSTELAILKFYANLSGIAIDSSHKYGLLENKYELEKETTSLLAHEIKTPLSITYNSCRTLGSLFEKEDDLDMKKIKKLYAEASASVDRLNEVCKSIFKLRDLDSNEVPTLMQKLDLDYLLGQLIDTYSFKIAEKGIDFDCNVDLPNKQLFGPVVQFEQVITILLDNALKYTDSGEITLDISLNNKKLCCKVTDTGVGIPPNKRDEIFLRYTRLDRKKGEGLGLGLYMAKKIVDKLEGKINIYDNPKKGGSIFEFELPVYKKLPY